MTTGKNRARPSLSKMSASVEAKVMKGVSWCAATIAANVVRMMQRPPTRNQGGSSRAQVPG